MASAPSATYQLSSPLSTVFSSAGKQHEKALKQAFYNTAAVMFVIVSGLITVGVYYVLEAFIRPLIWASLCGTFLHPFKKKATNILRAWMTNTDEAGTPLSIALIILPLQILNRISDLLGDVIKANYKLLGALFVIVPSSYYIIAFHPFGQIIFAMDSIVAVISMILRLFQQPLLVWSMFIGYFLVVFFWWSPSRNGVLRHFSLPVWIVILFHLASLAGTWKVILAILVFGLLIVGFASERADRRAVEDVDKHHAIKSLVDHALAAFGVVGTIDSKESSPDSSTSESDLSQLSAAVKETEVSTPVAKPSSKDQLASKLIMRRSKIYKRTGKSDPYFIALFWLLVLSRLWMHTWILQFLPILLVIYVLKTLYVYLDCNLFLWKKVEVPLATLQRWMNERSEVLLPGLVKAAVRVMFKGDKKVLRWMRDSTDKLMSVCIIICLILLAVFASIFSVVQVHHESSYLVHVATDVANQTLVSNEDYMKFLNLDGTDIRKTFDDAVHSAYLAGRKKVSGSISSLLSGEQGNSTRVEQQVMQFLDQLYDTYAGKNADRMKNDSVSGSSVTENRTGAVDSLFVYQWRKLKKIANLSDFSAIAAVVKENLHTLYSICESVWTILKGNVSLMLSIVKHTLSLLFLSGTFLLNGIVSTVIFLTTLFYLLSASSENYKLVEWFSSISMGTQLGQSVNDAIRDVFGASLKMATFYGLYTWLTHSVFGVNLVFIPSALAAMLGVVPFIGTYWAAVPGALEIYLIQKEEILAVLLLLLHLLPTYVVDTAIYSEIGGGGHPYLTGLAVAGGIYCLGLEGAIVGPIVLCCLVAAFNVYNGIMGPEDGRERESTLAAAAASLWQYRRTVSDDRSRP